MLTSAPVFLCLTSAPVRRVDFNVLDGSGVGVAAATADVYFNLPVMLVRVAAASARDCRAQIATRGMVRTDCDERHGEADRSRNALMQAAPQKIALPLE